MKKILMMLSVLMLVGLLANPAKAVENHNVDFLVQDANGETIPGATIVILNTSIGTTTDIDGKATLSLPYNTWIQVRMCSFITEDHWVSNESSVVITLEDSDL